MAVKSDIRTLVLYKKGSKRILRVRVEEESGGDRKNKKKREKRRKKKNRKILSQG